MDPVLQHLIRYQELSLEAARIKARLEEFPRQLDAIDAALQSATGSLATAKTAVADRAKEKRKLEADLQDLEAKLGKYNGQLMQVKTNEEYKAMQHEIAGVKEKINAVEEKILVLMEAAEDDDRRVKDEERVLVERRREAEASKEIVRKEQAAIEAEAARVAASRDEARGALTPDVLDMFDRIAGGREGKGIARARDERCQECKVRIRPAIYQEIRHNDRIIQCDSCRRILYYIPEEPPKEADGPAS